MPSRLVALNKETVIMALTVRAYFRTVLIEQLRSVVFGFAKPLVDSRQYKLLDDQRRLVDDFLEQLIKEKVIAREELSNGRVKFFLPEGNRTTSIFLNDVQEKRPDSISSHKKRGRYGRNCGGCQTPLGSH